MVSISPIYPKSSKLYSSYLQGFPQINVFLLRENAVYMVSVYENRNTMQGILVY